MVAAILCSGIAKAQEPARLFGSSVINNGDFNFNASFTPDSKTVFFTKASVNWGYIGIFYATRVRGHWTTPRAVTFTGQYRDCDPFVAADGKYLYFSSDRPLPGQPFKNYDYHLFKVNLNGNRVISEPALVELPVAAGVVTNYCTFAANGTIYFSAAANVDSEIYRCVYSDGHFLPPEKLPFNNDKLIDYDPMIASDESFIVFSSNNRKGLGGADLWISYHKAGGWTEPVNLGKQVNTPGAEGSAGLSRDNKTLYFSSSREVITLNEREKPADTQTILNELHGNKNGLRNIYEISIDQLNP